MTYSEYVSNITQSIVESSLCVTGSGSLAAMAVFEDRYKKNMEVIVNLGGHESRQLHF